MASILSGGWSWPICGRPVSPASPPAARAPRNRRLTCTSTPQHLPNEALRFGLLLIALLLVPALVPVARGAETPPISISSVSGSFLPNTANSGPFIGTPDTAVAFTQEFPVINFNPPTGTVKCSNAISVDVTTRPFTDVVPQPDGSCKTLPAQGKNQQAGVGDLTNFQAVFTGAFQVTSASRVTFNFFSDDGWVLSLGKGPGGAQPTYVSGPLLNAPKAGPFTGFAVVGSYNVVSSANQNNLTVNFPAAGTYPFELDYSDCCEGELAFTLTANNAPIPPTTALSLEVHGLPDSGQVQGMQHLEVVAAAGQVQQVELLVDNRSRGVSKTAPFSLDWDATQESPGQHKVVVRGTDASGATTDKELTVDVTAAAPAAAAAAAPSPITATTTAAAALPVAEPFNPLLVGGAIAVLLLLAIGAFFIIRGARPAPTRAPEPVVAAPVESDSTEFIGRESLKDLTMVSSRRPQLLPKAKLMVKPDREIPLSRSTPTILGRDSSLPAAVDDRQVSRHHAKVICEGDDFWVEDLNSTNGTRVNGVRVERQKLANNDQIGLGDAIVTFTLE